MAVSIHEFWKLLVDSRLLTRTQCEQLSQEFGSVKGAAVQGNSRTLAEWLIAQNVLSRYQARVLLAGQPGPFHYGEYKVHDRIEGGTLARMFKAVHVATGHPVALRFLAGTTVQSPERWAQAVSQTRALFSVIHPNLSRAYELLASSSFKFLAFEDLRGQPLSELLETAGRLPPPDACRIVYQAALGLAHLHQSGRVHGDVRPGNIWILPSGSAKLYFDPFGNRGAVNLLGPDPQGHLKDRADYMAPELGQPGRCPDVLTDIYSLGCTMYHTLAGRVPFSAGDTRHKLAAHASQPIQPLDQVAGVPQPMAQLVAYLMAKKPEIRFQQASIVVEQLAGLVNPAFLNPQPAVISPTAAEYEKLVSQHHRTAEKAGLPEQAPVIVTTDRHRAAEKERPLAAKEDATSRASGESPGSDEPVDRPQDEDEPENGPAREENGDDASKDKAKPRPKGKSSISTKPRSRRWLILGGVFALIAIIVAVLAIVAWQVWGGGSGRDTTAPAAATTPSSVRPNGTLAVRGNCIMDVDRHPGKSTDEFRCDGGKV